MSRLSVKEVVNKKEAGYYCDGGGLNLQVSDSGSKSWIFRYTLNGKNRHMGLGPFYTVSLADARHAAVLCRQSLLKKVDPISARDAEQARQSLEAARSITFLECATAYIKTHRSSWKNAKHADQWEKRSRPIVGR